MPEAPSLANEGASGGRWKTALASSSEEKDEDSDRSTQKRRRRGYDIQGLDEGHLSLRGVADQGMQPPNISEMRIGRLPSRQLRATPTVAIRGDLTNLFFNDLDLRWKLGPVCLIGFTTSASPFCLQLLGRDRGMRLRFCRTRPNMKAVLRVLDGALPRDRMRMHLPSSTLSDLVLWILAPSARASAKEIANA